MSNQKTCKGFISVFSYSSMGVFVGYLLTALYMFFGGFVLEGFREGSLIVLIYRLGAPIILSATSAYAAANGVYNNCIRNKKETTPRLVPWMTTVGYLIAHAIGIVILGLIGYLIAHAMGIVILRPVGIDLVSLWVLLVAIAMGAIGTFYWVNQMIKGNIQPMLD